MEALISLSSLFFFLIAGMLLARIPSLGNSRLIRRVSVYILFGLLFFMGFRMGRTTENAVQLAETGLLALIFALGTTAGTVAVLIPIYSLEKKKAGISSGTRSGFPSSVENFDDSEKDGNSPPRFSGTLSRLKDPLKLFLFVAAGFAAGVLFPWKEFTGEVLSSWMLRLLLLAVGMDLVTGGVRFKEVLARKETLILPLGTAVGSLAGGLCAGLLFNLHPARSLAVAAGFGWYSLSGVIISDLGDPLLGSAAFMSNILRETIALLTIPLAAATRFPNIAIGLGGATSMDVTLPLIERSCGPKAVPLAIASGGILSLLVPLLVPLFYGLGGAG